ncbi:TetR/AcrR family transcriptional regulator [Mycobacterium sp. SP-6446]|uniref:TetR/AcrR family transcriptional regulator n=1 Tax=Mycobacterium sp. SP-6446 TaxID=1834162 RepID=UPI0009FAF174|nr:TetR/AcrR family transcriptional regulator [Mycobacterium sp. SP-6446]
MSTLGKRRPGRPPQFDRQCALDALLMLFWRKGYDAATQEEMLAATGLSSSTLYRSFGTKADIMHTVLQNYVDSACAMLIPLERGRAGAADVHAFLDEVEELIRGPMGTAGCLAVETMRDPINRDPRIKSLTDGHLRRMRRGLRGALRRAEAAGELAQATPSTPARLADALQAGVLGALARARSGDAEHALALLRGVRALLPDP